MTAVHDFLVLARANARAFRGKTARNLTQSRLLTLTLLVFLAGYQIVAYLIFGYGLEYLRAIPSIGLLLVERVHHMLFFMFFVMLACSNCILLYSGIFRIKETSWLLTLPLSHKSIFLWKVVEAFVISSWGVVIITAPMLLAFGTTFHAPLSFYPKALILYVPYLLLPATLSAMVVIFLVRFWGVVLKYLMWGGFIAVAISTVHGLQITRKLLDANTAGGTSEAIASVLGQTSIASHPLLPSTWVSDQLYLWMQGYQGHSWYHAGLIISSALFGLWLCAEVFSRATFNCWVRSQGRKADRTASSSQRSASALSILEPTDSFQKNPLERLGLSRESSALILKDIREFTRDPAQWIPFAVIYALMFLYRLNMREYDGGGTTEYWATLVRYLNFVVCALVVSTLSTRFIFPIYSLEGRRLWILGLAPINLCKVFWLKLLLYATVIGGASGCLMFMGGTQEQRPWSEVFFFVGGILLQTFGMTSISLGLGVLFPNFQETNPAKIVSSYGGTLCLIVNFLYITLFMGIFVATGLLPQIIKDSQFLELMAPWLPYGFHFGVILTVISAGTVIFLALRQIKRLEHLRML